MKRIAAYSVHLLTATGAVFGLLMIYAIHNEWYIQSFIYMFAAIFVDSIDGTFARMFDTKKNAARVDGALLDNIIDFVTYVIAPAFFFMVSSLLAPQWRLIVPALLTLASSYQFAQADAKTDDHFFKGFPDYWNILVMYLYLWNTSQTLNLVVTLILIALVFVPIKYVYPSRMEYLSKSLLLRRLMLLASVLWGVATVGVLLIYPRQNTALNAIIVGYILLYTGVSLYRTFVPLRLQRD